MPGIKLPIWNPINLNLWVFSGLYGRYRVKCTNLLFPTDRPSTDDNSTLATSNVILPLSCHLQLKSMRTSKSSTQYQYRNWQHNTGYDIISMTGSITHVQQQSFQYPTTIIYTYNGEETAPHKEQLPVPGNWQQYWFVEVDVQCNYSATIYMYNGEETAPHKEQLPIPGNWHAAIPIRWGECNYSAPVVPINTLQRKACESSALVRFYMQLRSFTQQSKTQLVGLQTCS